MNKTDSSTSLSDIEKTTNLRHGLSHIMAFAVSSIFPDCKLGIGPTTEYGFFHDFELNRPLNLQDLEIIEEEMKKIIKKNYFFDIVYLKKDEVLDYLHQTRQVYKAELAASSTEDRLGLVSIGSFKDLCREVHIKSTSDINVDSFKLVSVAGAYWKGDNKRVQLQRINCIAFNNEIDLSQYFEELEIAKSRDHRKLGVEMNLFLFNDNLGAGLPIYLPKGAFIIKRLQDYIYEKEKDANYQYVITPSLISEKMINRNDIFKTLKDNMYEIKDGNENIYLRPINCPQHFLIYKSKIRSYKELPIAYNEFANDFRNEKSGSLYGLMRGRTMIQNDAHIFCKSDQVYEEFLKVLNMFNEVYRDFNIKEYWFRLTVPSQQGLLPNQIESLNEPTRIIKEALNEINMAYTEVEAQTYLSNPRLDVQIKTNLGKEETLGSIQIDFSSPQQMDLNYINKEGLSQSVVVIHRSILGSFDSFLGLLIEITGGNFPVWLSPIQTRIIPIASRHIELANKFKLQLEENNIRTEVDSDDDSMQNKIRQAQIDKIPYMLIIGDKELAQQTVSIRPRLGNVIGMMKLEEFITIINSDIENKK